MNAVFLLSGGLDSQVLLGTHREYYRRVHCVGFDYGQRHVRELTHAEQIARYYGATFEIVKLPHMAGSALTGDGDIPHGIPYADRRQSVTVVPGRNAVFLAHAVGIAKAGVRMGAVADTVLIAAHAGDAAVYFDCRGDFISLMSSAMRAAYGVRIDAPFLGKTKGGIVETGKLARVPMGDSWSCYAGGDVPCGKCGACMERLEAMS